MKSTNQTLLVRFSVAASVFALVMAAVAASSSGGSTQEASPTGEPVAIALTEFALAPATVTVPKGGSIDVSNNGTMVHNVAVLDTAVKSKDLAAGESAILDVSALAPGEYEIFCSIPGHKDSGMTGKLIVTDGGGASAAAAEEQAAADGEDHAAMGHDVSSMVGTSAEAKAMNKRMEEAMAGGVEEFLATAEEYAAGGIDAGNEKLEPTILPDGTKRFDLTAAITDWEVSPGKVVKAWTYNGRVPGPWLRVEPGDDVQVRLTNNLPISTDIHWHGISVPNDQDGVAPITQDYIRPYETYTYEWTAPDHSELGMYHAHMHGQEAIVNGLFAVVQVGDVPLPSGPYGHMTVPPDVEVAQEIPMVLNDAGVIGLSLNGKAFPATAPIVAEKGDWVLIHFYNEGLVGHPMHLHRQSQLVVAKDGFPLAAPYQADTVWVSPGERYSVLVRADEAGTWAFHCHIVNHAESDDGLFGMVTAMVVTE
ncbi:MAG TPA: multicopper oxidase domain-containing protein [Aquihabitans sp.]|jgi:FtsP/CotA-like multicopper oxidase with cupredoxin domain|nr:multicopper oxidase domain-containing protein [Aquihabitans sp.]